MLGLAVLLLAPLANSAQEWTAEGLHGDESVSACVLALPSEEVSATRSRGLRVLDGLSGTPLADVRVELWDEYDSRLRCVDRTRTARDGSCLLDPHDGAEKLILRKDGYASEELGYSRAETVFLFPERPLIGRVLDFEGRPIAGARIATRQSCKHAPHATAAQSDARGQFRMIDFPGGPNGASIEITAPGFAAESLEDETRWWTEIEATGEALFFLARQPELSVRLVYENGENCVGVLFENYERPLMFAESNASGELTFPSWPTNRGVLFAPVDGSHYDFRQVLLPHSIPITLRGGVPPTPEPDNLCLVTVKPSLHGGDYDGIAFEDLESPYIPNVAIFTPSGETFVGLGPHALDNANGTAMVFVGEAFRGWRESWFKIELEGEAVIVDMRVERETSIEFVFPERADYVRARVEVNGLSKEIDALRVERWGLSLPIGAVTFLTEFENGQVRRYRVENSGDADVIPVNLMTDGEVIREAWWTEDVVAVESNRKPTLSREVLEIFIDESRPEIARVHCPLVETHVADRRIELHAVPGPLDVVIEFEDGRAAALTLNLRVGESRRITLR